jgi:hypothetical protein
MSIDFESIVHGAGIIFLIAIIGMLVEERFRKIK